MQLLEHNELSASLGEIADTFCQTEDIVLRVGGIALLQESDVQFFHYSFFINYKLDRSAMPLARQELRQLSDVIVDDMLFLLSFLSLETAWSSNGGCHVV